MAHGDREQERREVKAIASRKASGGMVAGLSFQRILCSSVRGGGESESPPFVTESPRNGHNWELSGIPRGEKENRRIGRQTLREASLLPLCASRYLPLPIPGKD